MRKMSRQRVTSMIRQASTSRDLNNTLSRARRQKSAIDAARDMLSLTAGVAFKAYPLAEKTTGESATAVHRLYRCRPERLFGGEHVLRQLHELQESG